MRVQRHRVWLCALVFILLVSSCNNVKYLHPGERLYTGAIVKVKPADGVNTKRVRKEMEAVLRPRPNQVVVGMRFKLWLYNVAGEHPKKGFKKMLKNKLGEKPVLYTEQLPQQVADIMVNRLNNLGYFDASVRSSVGEHNKKVKVTYSVTVTRPYSIRSLDFPKDSSLISWKIRETQKETLLKPGTQYDLELLKAERQRIDAYLKNEGYYFFNPDYLLFTADSTVGDRSIALRLRVKRDSPSRALTRYYMRHIYIYPSFNAADSSGTRGDTLKIEGYDYIASDSTFHAHTVLRCLFLKPGELYSRKGYNTSLSRLTGLGVFRYTNIRFRDTVVNGLGQLDAFVYLTPMFKRSLQLELRAVTKSNNYTGPELSISARNRNLFGGAELLLANLGANFETQFTGIQKGFNSYEFSIGSQLFLQRFVAPVTIRNVSSVFVPRTKFDISLRTLKRVQYFSMNSISFSYGYTWKETAEKEHTFNPLAVNFAQLVNTTPAFRDLLEANPFLRQSFEEQFTLGGNYAFTYNTLIHANRRHQYYFNGMVDVSGNLISLANRVVTQRRPSNEEPYTIFGAKYSQFSKFSADGRYYFNINKNSRIVTRLFAGIGIPYGNSTTLPYVKQFFSGGSNSIRAFLPRTVGPGSYQMPDSLLNRGFLDKAGDIKLEGNIEYRFTIIDLLKGALFVDAGNVWLLRDNVQLPGGQFRARDYYTELAVGTGFGLRADLNFFVLRFDLGMPLRKPYLPPSQRWVISQVNFGDRSWRRQNLVLNIAIGYPF